jgi:hypothetical protein
MQAENLANEIAQWATNRRAQLENRKQSCERFGYLLFALGKKHQHRAKAHKIGLLKELAYEMS